MPGIVFCVSMQLTSFMQLSSVQLTSIICIYSTVADDPSGESTEYTELNITKYQLNKSCPFFTFIFSHVLLFIGVKQLIMITMDIAPSS